jgi:hypothetical protein
LRKNSFRLHCALNNDPGESVDNFIERGRSRVIDLALRRSRD